MKAWSRFLPSRSRITTAAGLFLTTLSSTAIASETIRYFYDARGRLIEVERAQPGTVVIKTKYTYDRADNRTKKEVTRTP